MCLYLIHLQLFLSVFLQTDHKGIGNFQQSFSINYAGLPPSLQTHQSVHSLLVQEGPYSISSNKDSSVHEIIEPRIYKQAIQVAECCEAMNVELVALEANAT